MQVRYAHEQMKGDVQDASSLHKQAEEVSDTCLFMHKCCCTKDITINEIKMPAHELEVGAARVNNMPRHPAETDPTSRRIHASIILQKRSGVQG